MSEIALKLIAENKAKHARGEDARTLDLGNCCLNDLPKKLEELYWLEELNLTNKYIGRNTFQNNSQTASSQSLEPNLNKLIEIKRLSKLKRLKKLSISKGPFDGNTMLLSDISPLKELTSLEHLDIHGTSVDDISPLSNVISLCFLNCSSTKIRNLHSLSKLENLEQINFSKTDIEDSNTLCNFKKLRILNCSNTKVNELKPVAELFELRKLNCANSLVSDISPIANLLNLEEVNCSETKVADIKSLKNLRHLKELNFSGTQVSDLSPILPLIKENILIFKEYSSYLGRVRKWFGLGNNSFNKCPLIIPPTEVFQRGNAAILRYFEDLEKYKDKKRKTRTVVSYE